MDSDSFQIYGNFVGILSQSQDADGDKTPNIIDAERQRSFAENQENMRMQGNGFARMQQGNGFVQRDSRVDEQNTCTPVTAKRCLQWGIDGSDDDEHINVAPKKARTDWQNVTQTQDNNLPIFQMHVPMQQVNSLEYVNIFSLPSNQLRSAWNELPDCRLAKFRTESAMGVLFVRVGCVAQGRSCIVEEVIGKLDCSRYAVKQYRPDRTYMRQFIREVQALALVREHPNIVTYYNAWIEKDISKTSYKGYIQLKLCKETLSKFLKNNDGKLSDEQAKQLMKQIGSALDHIHSKGIAHVDVKPDNIFVVQAEESGGGEIQFLLGDFGQAAPLNSTGLPIEQGDSRYLAWEVLNRDRSSMDLGDMYSFGATLYQCVGGVDPGRKEVFSKLREGKNPMKLQSKNKFYQKILALCDRNKEKRMRAKDLLQENWSTLPFIKKK